jgi:hypothetical protein
LLQDDGVELHDGHRKRAGARENGMHSSVACVSAEAWNELSRKASKNALSSESALQGAYLFFAPNRFTRKQKISPVARRHPFSTHTPRLLLPSFIPSFDEAYVR